MLLVIGAVLLGLYLFRELYWKRKDYPPGPIPLPVMGNMVTLMRHGAGYDALQMWKDKYGPVFTLWTGGSPAVAICDLETIKETIVKDGDSYADRKMFDGMKDIVPDSDYGILNTNGPLWREQRRFGLHALRDFGMGKKEMQERILDEIDFMMNLLKSDSKGEQVLEITKYLNQTVGSIINLVTFGYRYDENTVHEFQTIRDRQDKQAKEFTNPLFIIMFFIPFLRHLPLFNAKYQMIIDSVEYTQEFFKKHIEQHRAAIDYETEDASDFCELYLKEMKKHEHEKDTTYTERQLLFMCIDIWGGGMETTSATLAWGIAFLIRDPAVQEKMRAELREKIGNSGRLISTDDRTKLNYCNAVVSEVQRAANILPQNLARTTTRDVVINGFPVKQGTTIIPQISMLLYDPVVFPNPHSFNPEHFLDTNGEVKKIEHFLPFSMGKRQCPGEALARMELFLFLTNLVYRFEILPESEDKLPSIGRTITSATRPQPFKCRLRSLL